MLARIDDHRPVPPLLVEKSGVARDDQGVGWFNENRGFLPHHLQYFFSTFASNKHCGESFVVRISVHIANG